MEDVGYIATLSFNGIAQSNGVVSNAIVSSYHCDESRRIAQGFRRGKVNRIQSSDRLDGEPTANLGKDGFRDAHDMTTLGKFLQREHGSPLLLRSDPSGEPGTKHGSTGFGQGKSRRDSLTLGSN